MPFCPEGLCLFLDLQLRLAECLCFESDVMSNEDPIY